MRKLGKKLSSTKETVVAYACVCACSTVCVSCGCYCPGGGGYSQRGSARYSSMGRAAVSMRTMRNG